MDPRPRILASHHQTADGVLTAHSATRIVTISEVPAIMLRFWRLWWIGRRNLRVLWLALHHPSRPAWLLPALAVLVLYSLEPLNFAIPFLGVVDDLILLPIALNLLIWLLPPEIRADSSRRRSSPIT